MIDTKRLIAETDIVALIGQTVRLRKIGHDYEGLCPFHNEKSPSFRVFTEGEPHYHCYGCGAHGDAIRWLQETEGLSFLDACKELGGTHDTKLIRPPKDPKFPHPRHEPITNWGGQHLMTNKPNCLILDDFPGRRVYLEYAELWPEHEILWYPERHLTAERMYLAPIALLQVETVAVGYWECLRADRLVLLIAEWRLHYWRMRKNNKVKSEVGVE